MYVYKSLTTTTKKKLHKTLIALMPLRDLLSCVIRRQDRVDSTPLDSARHRQYLIIFERKKKHDKHHFSNTSDVTEHTATTTNIKS